LDEIRHVLYRPKFGFSPEQSLQLLDELHAVCDIINPIVRLNVVTSDLDDNMVLECALESGASFVVSGDRYLLDLVEFHGIQIVTPSGYLKRIEEKKRLPAGVRGQPRR
jgi:predicted nucleic acid-binding protein